MKDDELRARGPQGLSPDRHAALRAALLEEIEADVPTEPPGSPPDRHAEFGRRRHPMLLKAAAAIVALAAGAAAALVLASAGNRTVQVATAPSKSPTILSKPCPSKAAVTWAHISKRSGASSPVSIRHSLRLSAAGSSKPVALCQDSRAFAVVEPKSRSTAPAP